LDFPDMITPATIGDSQKMALRSFSATSK
jgi:hypothetical protein